MQLEPFKHYKQEENTKQSRQMLKNVTTMPGSYKHTHTHKIKQTESDSRIAGQHNSSITRINFALLK